MQKRFFGMLVFVLTVGSISSRAQAPAGTTGICNDGSYSTAASKRGACSGHQGVRSWYAATSAAPTAVTAAPSAPPVTAVPPVSHAATPIPNQAPGGGNGQVWVNTPTKVYHCPSDRYYGKTKTGVYMTEAAAAAQGDRPTYGKTCSH